MPNFVKPAEVVEEIVAKAAESSLAQKLIDDASEIAAKWQLTSEPASVTAEAENSFVRPKFVESYNRKSLKSWNEFRKRSPDGYRSGLSSYDQEYDIAMKLPVLEQHVTGNNLSVLEIGSRADVAVPYALKDRMDRYISVDIDENKLVYDAWHRSMENFDLSTENHFRVAGSSLELPIASNSQDYVIASKVPTMLLGNDEPSRVKDLSFQEVARVLKPQGRFLLMPFDLHIEMLEGHLLTKYFDKVSLHNPSARQLREISRAGNRIGHTGGSRQDELEDFDYRTFVGAKRQ